MDPDTGTDYWHTQTGTGKDSSSDSTEGSMLSEAGKHNAHENTDPINSVTSVLSGYIASISLLVVAGLVLLADNLYLGWTAARQLVSNQEDDLELPLKENPVYETPL